jgi:hypothetical protein
MKGRARDAVGRGEGKGYPLPNLVMLQIVLFPSFYMSGFLARKEAPYAKIKQIILIKNLFSVRTFMYRGNMLVIELNAV